MKREAGPGLVWLALALLVASCAPGTLSGPTQVGGAEAPAAPKRLTAAINGTAKAFGLGRALSAVAGEEEITELVNSGLSTLNPEGRLAARLAQEVPSTDNGLWKVFPDGRMETTWKIRPGATWHDGEPFTADDLVFTSEVVQDKSLTIQGRPEYQAAEAIEAPDPQTFVVKWARPYLYADSLMSARDAPAPKHLLEQAFNDNKATFQSLPYWTEQFIGSGPYRVREWVTGSHFVAQAYDGYVLGRPRIAEIEVRFIPDSETLVANVLAGTVQLTLGRGIAVEQGLQVRDQWKEGSILTAVSIPMIMYTQFRNPSPAAMTDARFRRALMHAINRQRMVDTLLGGITRVAYGALYLSDEDRRDLDSSIVRYEHDPAAAARLLEEVGYRRGADGMFRDAFGQSLSVDLSTTPTNAIQLSTQLVVSDDWQRSGVAVNQIVVPQQQVQDPRYKIDYRAFSLRKQPITLDRLQVQFHSGQIPTIENNLRGANYAAYTNPELDGLIERFGRTIPRSERMELGGRILHTLSDQMVIFGLYYDVEVILVANRVKNVTGRGVSAGESWNAYEWDMTS